MFNNRYALAVCQKKNARKQTAGCPKLAHASFGTQLWIYYGTEPVPGICFFSCCPCPEKIVMLSSRYRPIFIIITTIIIDVHLNKLHKSDRMLICIKELKILKNYPE